MEVVAGALPSVITRLGELLADDFSLLKEVKREIMFVRSELESMLAFVQKISMTPEDRLDEQDKIWANEVRDMSYHVEGAINKFMAQFKGRKPTKHHGFKEAIDSSVEWLMQPMTRRKFAKVIRDIVSHVKKVAERHERYMIGNDFAKPVPIYPRLLTLHQMERELVGIREAAGEVIKILQEGNEVSNQQDKIVSIVGFGGLGKTALANVVYEKLRAQFDCSAFVPVSQTPDMDKLLKAMVFELEGSNRGTNVFEETFTIENIINELREFLGKKRYLLVIDDISDIKVWEMIKCALPNNNVGNKIITTTRIFSVAEQVGGAYKMKPLSLKNSRTLLYKRVFYYVNKDNKQNIEKYPDEALAEVSDKILKSCAGVPLAIIVKASLLVSLKERYSMEWYEAYDSICTGLETSLKMHSMRKILSFNYYDLPFHLRTCLLYLSMFPKDYNIDKNRLIWMWIAEDFIQCTEQGESLFELGENYFNELINRSMIQPTHTGTLEQCRVHNMMLDLISALSSDINFVTIDHTSLSNLIRRFSLQNGNEDHAMTLDNRNLLQVRSVIVFPSAVCPMPALGDFRLLFVLDLNDCDLSQSFNLKFLGNLFNLRYLGLSNTRITQLPEEVGNLEFLQTLNITCNEISSLPLTVVQLTQLMCLRIDMDTRVPNGIASLTSLEELSQIGIYNSRDIEMLCCLPRLRVLGLCCHNEDTDSFEKSLVECLNKLQYIQNLNIWVASNECKLDSFVAPPHLRRLSLRGCWLSTLPAWVHLSLLQHLSFLDLSVIELQEEGIIILGILRSLCYLNLKVDHENLGILRRFVIGADLFHCLLSCVLWGFRGPVIFQQGAMPCVTSLRFTLHVQDMREISGSSDGGYDLGLQNLSSLEDATILFRCGGTSDTEVEEVKVALRRVTKIHPNHPKIVIEGYEDKDE